MGLLAIGDLVQAPPGVDDVPIVLSEKSELDKIADVGAVKS